MRYLFFDIECANSFNKTCKMCSFGYVVIDEKFTVLIEEDIVMGPEAKLAYSKEYFYSQYPFKYYYQKIYNILTDSYGGIFGYAVNNEIKFIYDNCTRYDLDNIDVMAYDVALLAKVYENLGGSLHDLTKDISNTRLSKPHKSDDDAENTMLLLKYICENLELSIEEFLEVSNVKISKLNVK